VLRAARTPAVFLDRDGVINRDRREYVRRWAEFQFLPGVLEAFRLLAPLPYRIIVVTNQSAIGRGFIDRSVVENIHRLMIAEIAGAGGRVDAVYYCPHAPEAGCDCRKPRPGLFLQAASDWQLDLETSWAIGDSARDIAAASAIGVRGILVRTSHGQDDVEHLFPIANAMVCFDLLHAVTSLVSRARRVDPSETTGD